MLFNSYSFIFLFLPFALAGYEVASRLSQRAVVLWLGFISLVFYGWWEPALLIILIGSVLLNYFAAALISRQIPNRVRPGSLLTAAVFLNLLALSYYKYLIPSLNFFSKTFGPSKHWADIVLPLGISFFTFTQIAFLVDLKRGQATQGDLPNYLLFVAFFPHLIAGPILHHREMMPQFQRAPKGVVLSDLTVGFTWFVLGLAKKALIADSFAETTYRIFQVHGHLSPGMAWLGSQSYMLQLYFDFSGYSDMALGLARMFSIDFPLNFNSPYKSSSTIEVWERWHMTLGRYIFTYIYIPVSRLLRNWRKSHSNYGPSERLDAGQGRIVNFILMVALPMMFTMFVAGVWHGAGVHYIVFGLIQGLCLSVNYAWRQFKPKPDPAAPPASAITRYLRIGSSCLLTYLAFLVSLIFFRADSCAHAMDILGAMTGVGNHTGMPSQSYIPGVWVHRAYSYVIVGLFIVFTLPNTQQILTHFKPSLQSAAWNQPNVPRSFLWSPSRGWAITVGVLLFLVLVEMQQPSTFLYFQF